MFCHFLRNFRKLMAKTLNWNMLAYLYGFIRRHWEKRMRKKTLDRPMESVIWNPYYGYPNVNYF